MKRSQLKRLGVWSLALATLAVSVFALIRQASPPVQAPALSVPVELQEAPTQPPIKDIAPLNSQAPGAAKQILLAPLPSLDSSDSFAINALSEALHSPGLSALLIPDKLIRHTVAAVDNLPRRDGSQKLFPFHAVPGPMRVDGKDTLFLSEANSSRYGEYVSALKQVDVPAVADLYVRIYPLLQQAYEELGFPGRRFNDRLFEAFDDLLDAPEPQGRVEVIQPRVLYRYAVEDLESRSTGQKIMVRIGLENEREVKRFLERLRSELLRRLSGEGRSANMR